MVLNQHCHRNNPLQCHPNFFHSFKLKKEKKKFKLTHFFFFKKNNTCGAEGCGDNARGGDIYPSIA